MTVGLAALLYALQPTGGDPHAPGWGRWLLTVGPAALVLALLATAGIATGGSRAAALLGTAAGVAFALTATFMSGALTGGLADLFGRWETYLVVLAGLLAMVLLQLALRAGTLVAAQPGMTLIDPIVSILLGVLLFRERVRAGPWIALEVLGAATLAWAVVQLSRSPLLQGTESTTESNENAVERTVHDENVEA
jgi:hypothetical protein